MNNVKFLEGDGIIAGTVEDTIDDISTIAREGMKTTDQEIIRLMIKQ